MKIRDYIEKLSWRQFLEIISDFEQFERDGVIGDCALRQLAEKIEYETTEGNSNIVLWMNMVAQDCYRLIAEKALENGFYYNHNNKSLEYVYKEKGKP